MKRGFTLTEMMVALAIWTIISGIAYTAIRLNDIYRDLVFIEISLYRQNKKAHRTIIEELQKSQASKVNITDNVSPAPDEIYFQIPLVNLIDNNYNIPWGAIDIIAGSSTADYYIRYRVDTANLVRDILDNALSPVIGTETIIAQNIINLQAAVSGGNYYVLTTTAQRTTVDGHLISRILSSDVGLRN